MVGIDGDLLDEPFDQSLIESCDIRFLSGEDNHKTVVRIKAINYLTEEKTSLPIEKQNTSWENIILTKINCSTAILQKRKSRKTIWMGGCSMVKKNSNKYCFDNRKKHLAVIALTLLLALILWTIWGNITVGVTRYRISSDRLPDTFDVYWFVVI